MKTFCYPDGKVGTIPAGCIITFGLNEEQNRLVNEALPKKSCELITTNIATDLIAVPAFALIIHADALKPEDRNMLYDFYAEIGNSTDETLFWLGALKPARKFKKVFKCYENFDEFALNMKYHLLTAYRKSQRAKSCGNKLGECIRILSLIRSHPGIKTRELAERTELPIRTVQRRITALQNVGEWIEYDSAKKGWQLQYGVSILFDDYKGT